MNAPRLAGKMHRGHLQARLLSGLAYALVFLACATVLRQRLGFPLDDSWIHQVIARNLAQTHRLGFIPGQLTAGSTSLLWSCLLAAWWLIFPAASPVITSAVTSVCLLAAIGYTLKSITEDDALPPAVAWCLTLGPLASGNFLWFGLIGMEHLLFILLSLALVRRWMLPPPSRHSFDAPLLALFTFLLVLTRPEGLFLAMLLLPTFRLAQRRLTAIVAIAAGSLSAGLILADVNWTIGHRLMPQTMQGRQFLYRAAAHEGLRMRIDYLGQIVARCLKTWSFFSGHALLHGSGISLGVPLVLLLVTLAVIALRRFVALQASRTLLLCAWSLVIVLLYFLVLPSTGHGGRYLALPFMLFLPLELLGLFTVLTRIWPSGRKAALTTACAGLLSAIFSLHAWRLATIAQIDQIESEHGVMASWLTHNLPPGTIEHRELAVFDIGRIGYQLNGNLTDLGGLVDPTYLDYVKSNRTVDYLAQHHVHYLVLPSEADNDSADFAQRLSLRPSPGITLVPLHSICSDPTEAALAESSAITAYACQRAYRLVYSKTGNSDALHP